MTQEQKRDAEKDASQVVLDRIAAGNIAPRSRWYFTAKESVMWGAGIGCVLLGAVVISLLLLVASNNVWELRKVVNPEAVRSLLMIVPLMWIGLFAFFLVAAEYNVRHTKSGYRYPLWAVVMLPLVTSIALGMVFYQLGVSYAVDEMLERAVPRYKSFESTRGAMLHKPKQGQVAGVVVNKSDDRIVIVQSSGEQAWGIDASRLPERVFTKISVGDHVVAFGALEGESDFLVACAMRVLPQKGFRRDHHESRKNKESSMHRKNHSDRKEHYGERLEQKIKNFPPCLRLQQQGA